MMVSSKTDISLLSIKMFLMVSPKTDRILITFNIISLNSLHLTKGTLMGINTNCCYHPETLVGYTQNTGMITMT